MIPAPVLAVDGVLLPQDVPVRWMVRDGRIVDVAADGSGPAADAGPRPATPAAEPLALRRGWIVPGLVDLHCHVGLAAHGAVSDEEAAEQARTDRDAGVLLIRDAGSPADTRWMDGRDDLPRLIRAGRHIARTRRYLRNYGHEVEPEQLTATVTQEAARGDGWIKLVGDWIDRDTGDLAPCWPRWALDEAIATAHRLGCRVTAHVFGEDALDDLVAAGIDCLEHATGLTSAGGGLAERLAEAGVPIVPTLVNIDEFPRYAAQGAAKFPRYAEHMQALHRGSRANVLAAVEAGVPVLAGTDAGGTLPHGLLAQEVLELAGAGLSAEAAVAAGSWGARAFLLGGDGTIGPGDRADFVVLADDPRRTPETLLDPLHVVLAGRLVR
jgi:imidazolonepropionase-like amidohydrolase